MPATCLVLLLFPTLFVEFIFLPYKHLQPNLFPPHGLCLLPPRSLVSHNSRRGLPHRRQDTQAGPLYLGRCCPSHTGLQSPASPGEEQRQKVSENSTQQPHARSIPKRGKLSYHTKHKLLVLLCEAGWTTRFTVRAWCQRAIPKAAGLKCTPGAGATFGINYKDREKVQEASHVGIST